MLAACVSSESTDNPRHLLVKIVTCLPWASVWSKSGVQIVAVAPSPDAIISGLPASMYINVFTLCKDKYVKKRQREKA